MALQRTALHGTATHCTGQIQCRAEPSCLCTVSYLLHLNQSFVKSILGVEQYTTHKVFVSAECMASSHLLKFVAVVIVSGLFEVGTVFDGASAADGLLQHCWHSLV